MIIDITRDLPQAEYDKLMDLMQRYWHYQHHDDPNAPYWGDGPNALEEDERENDDDYEDADYENYYENLLDCDEKYEAEGWDLRVAEFQALMQKKEGWIQPDYNFRLNKEAVKFFSKHDYQYIIYYNVAEMRHHLYVKGEQAAFHYNIHARGFNEARVHAMVSKYGWTKMSLTVYMHDEGFKSLNQMSEWMYANCRGTYAIDVRKQALTIPKPFLDIDFYFEKSRDAIHFRMVC